MEPNKMMEIWRLNSILFFFVPGQLEETDQVVALLRGFNQVVRKEKYKEGWMLVLIHPALSNQFSIHHKMDDIELEIKKDCGVWTMVINNLSVFHTHPSKLSKEFPYSAHVTNYKAPFRKETITSEFVVYQQPKTLDELQAKVDQIERENHRLRVDREKAICNLNTLQRQTDLCMRTSARDLGTIREQQNNLQQEHAKLKDEYNNLQRKLDALKKQQTKESKAKKKQIAKFKKEKVILAAERDSFRETAQALTDDLARLEEEVERLRNSEGRAEQLSRAFEQLKTDRDETLVGAKSTEQELKATKQQLKHTEQQLSEMKGVHQRVKKELRDAKKNETERSAVMEEISANLKEKERENVILKDLFQKTKQSLKDAECAMEYCQITAVRSLLYWESTKHIFGDLLGCESFHATAETIAEIIVKKCNIMNAKHQTLSDEVVFHTGVYGYYLAETHLKDCTAYSRAFFDQLRGLMLDFEFIPPEEEAKVSGKGKKKTKVHTKVHIKHYYDKGDIEGHYRTTTTCLNVMDHTTIQDAQEVLNKAVNLPALTPMVWFVGKEGDDPFFVRHVSFASKVMEVVQSLKAGESLYFSSLNMERDE